MCLNPKRIADKNGIYKYITIPCRECEECKAERKASELVRAYYETQYTEKMHGVTIFVTLTMDAAHRPHIKIYKEIADVMGWTHNEWKYARMKYEKISCWDLDDIRKLNDDIHNVGQYGAFRYRTRNKKGEILRTDRIETGQFRHKFMVACERGGNREYTDDYGRKRKAQELSHYHMIIWFQPLQGQDFRDRYEDFFRLISEKWYKGIVHNELTDRDVARATEYIVSYIQKEEKNEPIIKLKKELEQKGYQLKVWNKNLPFNHHSTQLGEYLMEYIGVNQAIKEGKFKEASKLLEKGAPMPHSKEGIYYAKIPRYYIKKLTTEQITYSYRNSPEFKSFKRLYDNRDYIRESEDIRKFQKIEKRALKWNYNETKVIVQEQTRKIVKRIAIDYTPFGEFWKDYRENSCAISTINDIEKYIQSGECDADGAAWWKNFSLSTLLIVYKEKDKILQYDYLNDCNKNEVEIDEFFGSENVKQFNKIQKSWMEWTKIQKEQKLQKRKEEYAKRQKEAHERKPGLWQPRVAERAYARTYRGATI